MCFDCSSDTFNVSVVVVFHSWCSLFTKKIQLIEFENNETTFFQRKLTESTWLIPGELCFFFNIHDVFTRLLSRVRNEFVLQYSGLPGLRRQPTKFACAWQIVNELTISINVVWRGEIAQIASVHFDKYIVEISCDSTEIHTWDAFFYILSGDGDGDEST